MQLSCPCCAERFPIEAGFIDDDGKRLAALFAGMEPGLGRAVVGYLRLFKPPKQQLRSARAVRIVSELLELVDAGSVCRDERGGMRRPATQALWTEGIEQMLGDAGKLTLPLANHNYLRAIVYGLADKADAAAEREREECLRAGSVARPAAKAAVPVDRLANELAFLRQLRDYGQLDPVEYERRAEETRQRFGQPNQEAA